MSTQTTNLQNLSGIGPATDDSLNELGYYTIVDLYNGYLTDDAERISDTIRSVKPLHDGIHEMQLTAGDLGICRETTHARAPVMMMGFARIFGIDSRCLKTESLGTLGSSNKFAAPEDIEWVGPYSDHAELVNPASTVNIFEMDNGSDIQSQLEFEPVENTERGVGLGISHISYTADDCDSHIKTDYIRELETLFGRSLRSPSENIYCVADSNKYDIGGPVRFDYPEGGVSVMVAPRVANE